jgi:hypothetical protein
VKVTGTIGLRNDLCAFAARFELLKLTGMHFSLDFILKEPYI